MKRILSILLGTALFLSLVSCGGEETSGGSSEALASSTSQTVESDDGVESKADNGESEAGNSVSPLDKENTPKLTLSDCKTFTARTTLYSGSDRDPEQGLLTTVLYKNALNYDKMTATPNEHMPIYKFESVADVTALMESCKDSLDFDRTGDDFVSVNQAVSAFNDEYFADNTVFAIYVVLNSGTKRCEVKSVDVENGCMTVGIKETGEYGTDDMAGWFVFVSAPKNLVKDISAFDATMA